MDHREIERWYRLRNLKTLSEFLALAAVVLVISSYAVSRYFTRSAEEFQPAGETETGIRIDNFAYSSPGAHPWELAALSAQVSDNLDRVVLKEPKVIYQGGEGGEIVVTARSGELDRKDRSVSVRGDVTIRYKDMVFKSGEMNYSHAKLVAETSSPVSLKGRDLLLTGKGFKFFVDKEEVFIENDVEARLLNVKWVEHGRKLPM